ncbi:MAG: hypothetical protein HY913_04225 [Desulfomonile tiedjei]|nr:hypothetical protein [Desulfomonile tiedjei]
MNHNFHALDMVKLSKELPSTSILLLQYFLWSDFPYDEVYLSIQSIIEQTNLKERTIIRATQTLEKAGILTVRRFKQGSGEVNRYKVSMDSLQALIDECETNTSISPTPKSPKGSSNSVPLQVPLEVPPDASSQDSFQDAEPEQEIDDIQVWDPPNWVEDSSLPAQDSVPPVISQDNTRFDIDSDAQLAALDKKIIEGKCNAHLLRYLERNSLVYVKVAIDTKKLIPGKGLDWNRMEQFDLNYAKLIEMYTEFARYEKETKTRREQEARRI